MQRIDAVMAVGIPASNLVAITMVGKHRPGGIRVIIDKNKENLKLTYITPDWSPIDRIVVPNNRVNTQ